MKYATNFFIEKELLDTEKPTSNESWVQLIHLCQKREGEKKMKIEIVKSQRTGVTSWFFRIKAGNNKTLCHSEQYTSKQMAMRAASGITRVKSWEIKVL